MLKKVRFVVEFIYLYYVEIKLIFIAFVYIYICISISLYKMNCIVDRRKIKTVTALK